MRKESTYTPPGDISLGVWYNIGMREQPITYNLADLPPWRGRCSQCGKPSTAAWIRKTGEGGLIRVEWCDTHCPDVWQVVEKSRREALKRQYAAEDAKWRQVGGSYWKSQS